jgi:hypothetical protein
MNPKPSGERIYGPMLEKTFPQVLTRWLAEEFAHLGGPKVRSLFVAEVMRLIDTYAVAQQRLQPGQVVWYAVDKTDLPHDGQSMAHTRLVPVILTLVAREDIEQLIKGVPLRQVRRGAIVRVHREAEAQGGVLAEADTGLLIQQSYTTVSNDIRAYEHEHACVVPRRGTLHDLGRTVSHKALIAKKALHQAKSAPDVAWETQHSLPSVERYLVDLMRVYISLKRHAMTTPEAAFATGMSLALVKEYAALIAELDLNDERLPRIMADLERTAEARQSRPTKATACHDQVPSEPPQR